MAKGRPAQTDYKDVKKAAKAIEARGGEPTTSNVREELGRGSFSTIGQLLQQYFDEEIAKVTAEVQPDFLRAFSAEVMRVAEQKSQKQSLALKESRKQAQSMEETCAKLSDDLEVKEAQVVSLNKEVAAAQKRIEDMAQKAELSSQAHSSEVAAKENEIVAIKADIQSLRKQLASQQEEKNDLLVRCARMESTAEIIKEERDGLKSELETLRAKYEDLQENYRTSSLAAKGQEIKLETMAEQNSALRDNIAKLEAARERPDKKDGESE